jgi:hypothetical protein
LYTLPEYRLRLFLSVDLVGSTAYKADQASQAFAKVKPKWVALFTDFYREFPERLASNFLSSGRFGEATVEEKHPPKIWKTIGDEIVLCSRVLSIEHLVHTVSCFVETMAEYSKVIQKTSDKLDLKGNAWVAACPAPNIAFPLVQSEFPEFQDLDTSEEIELRIDEMPSRFDFLGKAIDTGFRISKNSKSEQMTVSVQLAYLLCRAEIEGKPTLSLEYGGRFELKGVNGGIPYPVIYINTERSAVKKRLTAREKALVGSKTPEPQHMFDFLDDFMQHAKIEKPFISFRGVELDAKDKPDSFKDFEQAFQGAIKEIARRDANYLQAEATDLPRAAAQPEDELEDIIERSEELATVRRGRSDDADPVRGDTVEG